MRHFRAVTPVLRYHDPGAAAEWLCTALGFDQDHIVEGPRGEAHSISLRLGDCCVIVCAVADSVLHELMVQPADVGGANTQICYLTVQSLDDHSKRAESAGARIELEAQDDGAGGRFYVCRDPEGHLWSIGTRAHGRAHQEQNSSRRGKIARRLAPVATVLLVLAAWLLYDTSYRSLSQTADVATPSPSVAHDPLRDAVADELARRIQAEMVTIETAQKLEQERAAGARLRQELQRVQADLSQTRLAKEDVDRALVDARSAKDATDRSSGDAATALTVERARAKAAQEAHDALLLKVAQLEAAVLAEKELRVKAEREMTATREQLARPQQTNATDPEQVQKTTVPVAREEIISSGDGVQLGLAPLPPEGAKTAPNSACALAVQGKVPHKGSNDWDATSLARLCRNAETSVEPAKCFDQLMRRQINWGGGTTWMASNALALCAGTRGANQTLDCFVKTVAADQAWRSAIEQCRIK